ncbi:hypothetical protein N1851_020068 [Merluccius polli]|uniref:Uncharacterized protein n=1 Tax=Merluccius polli TaxID=89951 RepID=A0AA47P054_MERPO|nr:hypothetical protein N1851_020068 [Merluccius polli]
MLRELQVLSLRLQQRDMDIVSANCQIQQCIDVLSAMKECGGKSAQKAEERITQGLFKGLELIESSGKIKRGQFDQSVIDNLKKRMPESDLVNMLKPLNKRFWPQDRNALILYGEKEIRALAKTLGESASEAVASRLEVARLCTRQNAGEAVHSKQNIPAHFIGVREGLFSCE